MQPWSFIEKFLLLFQADFGCPLHYNHVITPGAWWSNGKVSYNQCQLIIYLIVMTILLHPLIIISPFLSVWFVPVIRRS